MSDCSITNSVWVHSLLLLNTRHHDIKVLCTLITSIAFSLKTFRDLEYTFMTLAKSLCK